MKPDPVPQIDVPRALLLDPAGQFGIRADVAAVLARKEAAGHFGLRRMRLGKMLRHARKVSRLSGLAAASKSGVSRSTITASENDDSFNLRSNTALALARTYRLPIALVLCAALRTYGMLPEPGTRPVPRDRKRKPTTPG